MSEAFEGWVVLELMGHRKLGCYVREQEIAGAAFVRADVPDTEVQPGFSQFYAPAAVYCISPTTEEVARALASRYSEPPVQRYQLPAPRISEVSADNDMDDIPFDDGEEGDA